MADVPTNVPLAPFGVTIDGVTGLVPEVRLWTTTDPVPDGTYRVTATQVGAWLLELADAVSMALDGWERLSNTPVLADDEVTIIEAGDRDRLIGNARTIIHNGAASYLEAARHPERQGSSGDYAAVLWARYTDGLDRLTKWLTARLATDDPGDTPDPVDAGELAYSFPCPTFPDNFGV